MTSILHCVDNEESFEHHVIELYMAVCRFYFSLSLYISTASCFCLKTW